MTFLIPFISWHSLFFISMHSGIAVLLVGYNWLLFLFNGQTVSAMASPSFTTCCGFSLQRETEAGLPGRPRGLMGERSTRAQTCLPAASIASDPQRERPCCGRDGSVHEAQRLVCVLGAVAGGVTEDATCAGGQPWGQEPPRVPAPGGCLALVRGVPGGK